ncbi:hypothetical protein V1514DRAFT_291733 [Lipomyces japonicus]|uniref:uncharacterized protein n=1 Tax=Lipomyces japonicus TaxID=56871 RepID=UPI0034CD5252
MVVLAASVCTRAGKAVLSRQFRDIPKSRIEALLAAFPKLTHSGTQHTTVEDDNVRYVYQPLEELYMVLITNRQSNILQDIDTLQLFSQVVTSICKSADEREILNNAFELLSAFDEIVALGYRENLTLAQIKTNLEMDSHEEKIQEIIARNKELEANEERKRRAKQFDIQRREQAKRGLLNNNSRSSSFPSPSEYATAAQSAAALSAESSYDYEESRRPVKTLPRGKGMQLSKKSKATEAYETVREEIGIEEPEPLVPQQSISNTAAAGAAINSGPAKSPSPNVPHNDGILVSIVESVSGAISRDGTVQNVEVKGDLQLRVADPSLSKIRLAVDIPGSLAPFKTHPNVDKALFNSSKTIGLKDATRGFPSNNNPLGVLRWRLASKGDDSSLVPLSFTCWLSASGTGSYQLTIEYELQEPEVVLHDVTVTIPILSEIAEVNSESEYDHQGDHIVWYIGTISSETDTATGSFDLSAEAEAEDEFFPIKVSFTKDSPFANINLTDVVDVESGEPVPFEKDLRITVDNFTIE